MCLQHIIDTTPHGCTHLPGLPYDLTLLTAEGFGERHEVERWPVKAEIVGVVGLRVPAKARCRAIGGYNLL